MMKNVSFNSVPAGYPLTGTGTGVPGVQMAVPATVPRPSVAGMGFGGYRYGYGQKYPRVTRVLH